MKYQNQDKVMNELQALAWRDLTQKNEIASLRRHTI